jgi:hypothetical protein
VETAVGAIAECEPGASAGKEERVEVVGDQLCAVKVRKGWEGACSRAWVEVGRLAALAEKKD